MTAAHLQHQALHTPVLLREVVTALAPTDGGTYLDATFGNAGYTTAILEAATCAVIAIDRDPDAIARGAGLADAYEGRLTLHEGVFSEMQSLAGPDIGLDGIAFDLGVCSTQLDQPERGFSFRFDGPLDMRMSSGPSKRKEKPRSGWSSWVEQTPRSKAMPSRPMSGPARDCISENTPSCSVSRPS